MGWIGIVSAQSFGDNFKINYPRLVHQGKSFEISIITSNEKINADQLDLYLVARKGIVPDRLILHSENEFHEYYFTSASPKGFLYDAVMCSIDLSNTSINSAGSFFQVIIKFESQFVEYSEVDFLGEFRRNNRVIDYLKNSDDDLISDYPNYNRIKINFYNTAANYGKALLIQPNAEFTITPPQNFKHNLLLDFWISLDQKGFPFLEIRNNKTRLNEYRLSVNDFQILIPESDFNLEKKISPNFVPVNIWTHFVILFLSEQNNVEFYCNNKLLAVFEHNSPVDLNDFSFSFINEGKGSFQIDQVRITDFNEPVEVVFQNSNFADFNSNNSSVRQQFSFDNIELTELMQNEFVKMNNVALVQSDAPIFSRAPELNLQIMNNYFELTWIGGDFSNAQVYILEHSEGEQAYHEIYRSEADNSEEKTYTFLSERKPNSEVIHFRIKQINKDGSITYSSQVKVGQGDLEEFIVGQNYPNPFNPKTQISIEVLIDSDFKIVVYNLEGKRISVLHDGFLAAGNYQFTFDGSELPSGIYLYKAWSPNFSQTKKMILAK